MSGPDDPRPDDLDPRDDADLRAAEAALGLLGRAERREAERHLRTDVGFADAVARWDERFAPLLSGLPPVEPPPTVWQGVERDLARMSRASPPRVSAERSGLVAAFWRPFALASTGLLAASLAGLVVVSLPQPPPRPMTASLLGDGAVPLYTAVVYPGATGATLIPVQVSAAPGHSHELWMIAPGDAPRSLGVLAAGTLRIEIAPDMLAQGGVLAISLEPVGGSPTGQPTGPVVAKGELHRI